MYLKSFQSCIVIINGSANGFVKSGKVNIPRMNETSLVQTKMKNCFNGGGGGGIFVSYFYLFMTVKQIIKYTGKKKILSEQDWHSLMPQALIWYFCSTHFVRSTIIIHHFSFVWGQSSCNDKIYPFSKYLNGFRTF